MSEIKSEIKIDKNVPKPAVRGQYSRYPWKTMEVDDSFVIPDGVAPNTLYHCAKRQKIKISVRKQLDGTYRCWRAA